MAPPTWPGLRPAAAPPGGRARARFQRASFVETNLWRWVVSLGWRCLAGPASRANVGLLGVARADRASDETAGATPSLRHSRRTARGARIRSLLP